MAKFTSRLVSVPGGLLLLFEILTSPGKAGSSASGTLKKKRGKKKTKPPKKEDIPLEMLLETCQILANEQGYDSPGPEREVFIFERMEELRSGIVNHAYFRRCKRLSAVTLESIPSSVTDEDPPPYGYRTSANAPTVPTYPDGVVTANPPGYYGAKVGTEFIDQYWRWRKLRFDSKNKTKTDLIKRVLVKIDSTITALASSRGSRPMFSFNMRAVLARLGAAEISSTKPPITKVASFYWRFFPPAGGPPYYNATQRRESLVPFRAYAAEQGAGSVDGLYLQFGNRPMMGRGFNNNDYVQTSFDNDPELWEVKTCSVDLLEKWDFLSRSPGALITQWVYSQSLDLFVAGGVIGGKNYILRTKDMTNFEVEPAPRNIQLLNGIWVEQHLTFYFSATEGALGRFVRSPNGKDFFITSTPQDDIFSGLEYSPSLNILVASNSTFVHSNFLYTLDMVNWFVGAAFSQTPFCKPVWVPSKNKFFSLGGGFLGGAWAWSSDGFNWTWGVMPVNHTYNSIAYSSTLNRFVGTAAEIVANSVVTSTDGVTWSNVFSPANHLQNAVIWIPQLGRFVITGASSSGGDILVSSDGFNWVQRNTPGGVGVRSPCWGSRHCLLVAVPNQGAEVNNVIAVGPLDAA